MSADKSHPDRAMRPYQYHAWCPNGLQSSCVIVSTSGRVLFLTVAAMMEPLLMFSCRCSIKNDCLLHLPPADDDTKYAGNAINSFDDDDSMSSLWASCWPTN